MDRWSRLDELFHAALAESPTKRAEYLREACPDDPQLQKEVQELLARTVPGDSFLEGSPLSGSEDASPLSPNQTLGSYRIIELIGSGGMGKVYRAHDSRVNRDVAIKVSDGKFSERFEREARAIAALNHPNICTLFDVGPNYLVMEYIEGESPKGPLQLEESLRIARQIADALQAAHEKGIVHRDLKPSNIKIKPDGTVKVLDFGLAKVGGTPTVQTENSPTLTIGATQAGLILGTAAYMSPEQARGKPVDKRADIWAFGVVLHELMTGRQLFKGEDVGETLAAVIKEEPDWDATPAKVRRLLQSCLEKDPSKRLRDIGDAWRLLEDGAQAEGLRRNWPGWAWIAITTLLAICIPAAWFLKPTFKSDQLSRFQIPLPANLTSMRPLAPQEVSPDGRKLAFEAADSGGISAPVDQIVRFPRCPAPARHRNRSHPRTVLLVFRQPLHRIRILRPQAEEGRCFGRPRANPLRDKRHNRRFVEPRRSDPFWRLAAWCDAGL